IMSSATKGLLIGILGVIAVVIAAVAFFGIASYFGSAEAPELVDGDTVAGLFEKDTVMARFALMEDLIKEEAERFRHLDNKATTVFSILGLSISVLTALSPFLLGRVKSAYP